MSTMSNLKFVGEKLLNLEILNIYDEKTGFICFAKLDNKIEKKLIFFAEEHFLVKL